MHHAITRFKDNSVAFHVHSSADSVLPTLLAVGLLAIVPSASSTLARAILVLASALCLLHAATLVLSESLVALPPLGYQLEVHRGLRFVGSTTRIYSERLFIPRDQFRELVINEALHRWNVRYYLAILTAATPPIHVVFKNTLPPFPVLLECYKALNDLL